MLFKKWAQSITIVKKVLEISTNAIEGALKKGYVERNYYAKSECALLGFAAMVSQVVLKNDKIAKGIVKEACSGTHRRFLGKTDKANYQTEILRNYEVYLTIVKEAFNDNSATDEDKLKNMYRGIAQHIAKEIGANDSYDSLMFFYEVVSDVNDCVERYCLI